MTLQKDHDPGWWRRGMTKRATIIIVTICVAMIITGLVLITVNGIPLF